jgi:hypothetical protein
LARSGDTIIVPAGNGVVASTNLLEVAAVGTVHLRLDADLSEIVAA